MLSKIVILNGYQLKRKPATSQRGRCVLLLVLVLIVVCVLQPGSQSLTDTPPPLPSRNPPTSPVPQLSPPPLPPRQYLLASPESAARPASSVDVSNTSLLTSVTRGYCHILEQLIGDIHQFVPSTLSPQTFVL